MADYSGFNLDDTDAPLVHVDARGRVSLGRTATSPLYTAFTNDVGHVLLIPTTVIPDTHPVAQIVKKHLSR